MERPAAFGLTLFVCAALSGAQGRVSSPKPAALPPGTALYPGVEQIRPEPAPDITELRLERTRCLSGCPAYAVTFRTDGSFRYRGDYGVARLGEHTGRVEVGSLRQVFRYLDEIGFGELEAAYTSPFLDNAATIIRVVRPESRKTVTNYANRGPATLWALGELIDGLLEGATWDPGGGQK